MKLGIAVNNLGPSQLTYFIVKNGNAAVLNKPTFDLTVFTDNICPQTFPANFSSMPIYEAWGYNGILVATNYLTARKVQQCLSSKKKFFYVWDLEWTRPQHRMSYNDWSLIYRDQTMPIIARSKEHANIIEDCWNRKVLGIVDDVNLKDLLLLIAEYNLDGEDRG